MYGVKGVIGDRWKDCVWRCCWREALWGVTGVFLNERDTAGDVGTEYEWNAGWRGDMGVKDNQQAVLSL